MDTKQKAMRAGVVFIALLLISGLVLMYHGNDALALAIEKKEGILTAEQIKLSFDSVSGRLLNEAVKEGDMVRKGDIIMQLDSTDTDLSIEKLKAQLAQLEAQIHSTSGSQGISYMKADTSEGENKHQINQQQAAVSAANVTLKNAQTDYDRKAALVEAGAVAQSQLDDAETALRVAQANVAQQDQLLQKLLTGTNGSTTDSIAQARQTASNMSNDIESLRQQQQALEVQLKQLR